MSWRDSDVDLSRCHIASLALGPLKLGPLKLGDPGVVTVAVQQL